MKKIYLSLMLILGLGFLLSAQTTDSVRVNFKPSGRVILQLFTDYSNINSNGRSNNAFELSRSYFGYAYNFNSDFSGRIVLDAANTGVTPSVSSISAVTSQGISQFNAYVKNMYAEYSHNMITADIGIINENMFDFQEATWGRRYVYKSFQDQSSFTSAADLGAKLKLQFTPLISLDMELLNGEGYKKIQVDSTLQFTTGLTVQPIKNLYARVYFDDLNYTKIPASPTVTAQTSYNAYLAYKDQNGYMLAAEYDRQNGHGNVLNHNWTGISAYGALPVIKTVNVYARFDDLMSDKIGTATSGWNTATDGQVYMVGVEYNPVKGVLISPNYRYYKLAVGKPISYLNLNIGLLLL